MTQLIDFSPLSRIGDTYLKALEAQRDREEGEALVAQMERMGGGGAAAPAASSGAPAAPTGGSPSFAGGGQRMRMPADPELERTALETAKGMGLTNPFGLAAFAAHGNAESAFSPSNITGSWSDPSKTGKAGTSGGLLSWRDPAGKPDRFSAMRQATSGAGGDPREATVQQTKFALTENPQVTLALQNAKSLEEAHAALAASQRYADWNVPNSPENQRRLQIAQSYAQRFGGGAPTASAPASGGGMPGATSGMGQALQDPTTRELLASQLRRRDTRGAAVMKLVELRNKGDNFSVVDVGDGRKARMRGSDGQIDMLPDQDTPEQKHARALEIAKAGKAETNINTATNPLFDALGERYKTAMKSAGTARDAIYSTFEARRALEDGAIAGALSDQRLLGAKLFELFGVGDGSAQKTEVLRSMLGDNVLANINKLGSQPSSSDRVYIEKVKAGSIALEEGSIRTLVEIQEKAARKAIQNFNYMGAKVLADPKIREKMGEYSGLMVEDEPETYEQWLQTNGRRPAPGAASPQAIRGASGVVGPPGPAAPQGTVLGRFPWSLKATTPVQQPGSL